jgi:hypothetical protein
MNWGGQVRCCDILEVWMLTLLCLMWCIWRVECMNFEDRGTSVAELKKIIFNALYVWIAAHNSLIFSSFSNFLNHCYSFFF